MTSRLTLTTKNSRQRSSSLRRISEAADVGLETQMFEGSQEMDGGTPRLEQWEEVKDTDDLFSGERYVSNIKACAAV